jgi:hypothetical protein
VPRAGCGGGAAMGDAAGGAPRAPQPAPTSVEDFWLHRHFESSDVVSSGAAPFDSFASLLPAAPPEAQAAPPLHARRGAASHAGSHGASPRAASPPSPRRVLHRWRLRMAKGGGGSTDALWSATLGEPVAGATISNELDAEHTLIRRARCWRGGARGARAAAGAAHAARVGGHSREGKRGAAARRVTCVDRPGLLVALTEHLQGQQARAARRSAGTPRGAALRASCVRAARGWHTHGCAPATCPPAPHPC